MCMVCMDLFMYFVVSPASVDGHPTTAHLQPAVSIPRLLPQVTSNRPPDEGNMSCHYAMNVSWM